MTKPARGIFFYNFVAVSKPKHEFLGIHRVVFWDIFFVCGSWGVTTSWLRQSTALAPRCCSQRKLASRTSGVITDF